MTFSHTHITYLQQFFPLPCLPLPPQSSFWSLNALGRNLFTIPSLLFRGIQVACHIYSRNEDATGTGVTTNKGHTTLSFSVGTRYLAVSGLELEILLPQSPKFWGSPVCHKT